MSQFKQFRGNLSQRT